MDNIPQVALRWVVINSTTSNVELARLSNVCRSWRNSIANILLDLTLVSSTTGKALLSLLSSTKSTNEENGNDNEDSNGNMIRNNETNEKDTEKKIKILQEELYNSSYSTTQLLLPSMGRFLIQEALSVSSSSSAAAPSSPQECPQQPQHPSINNNVVSIINKETFCAAWFHPDGIKLLDIMKEQKKELEKEKRLRQEQVCEIITFQRNTGNTDGPTTAASSTTTRQQQQQQPSNEPFAPSGGLSYEGSGNEKGSGVNRHPSQKTASANAIQRRMSEENNISSLPHDYILRVREWRGYQNPMDVLQPFGYHSTFVQNFLDRFIRLRMKTLKTNDSVQQEQQNHLSSTITTNDVDSFSIDNIEKNTKYYNATFAVRGATVARPEGYCLCWEEERKHESLAKMITPTSNVATDTAATQGSDMVPIMSKTETTNTSRSRSSSSDWGEVQADVLKQEQEQALLRRKEMKREIQRTMLPRAILCPLIKNYQKNDNDNDDLANVPGVVNKCIQFLNADRSSSVRLLTPPFKCGPIVEPVTIFIVAIATEDGCFLSGLRSCFELGHMYPTDATSSISDLSAICIATNPSSQSVIQNNNNNNSITNNGCQTSNNDGHHKHSQQQQHCSEILAGRFGVNTSVPRPGATSVDDNSSYDSSNTSGISGGQSRSPCNCIFQDIEGIMNNGTTNDDDNDDDDDDDHNNNNAHNHDKKPEIIQRGQRGPGLWHCYTAIFDGSESIIRVDGVQELPQLQTLNYKCRDKEQEQQQVHQQREEEQQNKSPPSHFSGGATNTKTASLDGLSIGSDHRFDMSLCFGQGAACEGEGSISELVVFGGRLDITDIKVIEKYLMGRHGISVPSVVDLKSLETLFQEEKWTRQAHAIYCSSPHQQMILLSERRAERYERQKRLRKNGINSDTGDMKNDNGSSNVTNHIPESSDSNDENSGFTSGDGIPLRFMTRHRSVSWRHNNVVDGQKLKIKKIGCRLGESSSDF